MRTSIPLNIFRLIIKALVVAAVVALLVYTGWFHIFTLFLWQHPMLGWLPLLAFVIVGFVAGISGAALSASRAREAPPAELSPLEAEAAADHSSSSALPHAAFSWKWGLLAFTALLVVGLVTTIFATPRVPISDIDYETVDSLPQSSQPRLLPRTSVDDDPNFNDAKEIHLVRNPRTGELLWTGEWQSAWLAGPSSGIAVKNLDEVKGSSAILRGGFERSVAGIAPGTVKWESKWSHPVSRIQYPVLVPATTGEDSAFALAPYVGFRGFPFKTPYFKGVLVYHQDGTLEDLTPEEAADRPELVATGRIYPEALARAEAESVADELGGEIKDAEGNKQPFLTSIDEDTTQWVTVVNGEGANAGVIAIVMQNSSTGDMQVWQPREGEALVSTRYVIDSARALPLQWEERRCCDSEGDSYTVKLREVVEPRLAFKDGKPYYLVTVAPTDDLALARQVEYTLLIDAETGKTIRKFDHVSDPNADSELANFFR